MINLKFSSTFPGNAGSSQLVLNIKIARACEIFPTILLFQTNSFTLITRQDRQFNTSLTFFGRDKRFNTTSFTTNKLTKVFPYLARNSVLSANLAQFIEILLANQNKILRYLYPHLLTVQRF